MNTHLWCNSVLGAMTNNTPYLLSCVFLSTFWTICSNQIQETDHIPDVHLVTCAATTPPFNATFMHRQNFVDWLLSIVGWTDESKVPSAVQDPKLCQKCTCGLTNVYKRIIGGVETKINEFPWMVALHYRNRYYCGATVINNRYLLTAAHCVQGFTKERLLAVFLDHDRSNLFETESFTRNIVRIMAHKNYGVGATFNNDIALLKMDQPLVFTNKLRPVCLPPIGKSFTGNKGTVVGWGSTVPHGPVNNVLQKVDVPILANMACQSSTGYGHQITENMMCAGYAEGFRDACQGDSGGPLLVTMNDTKIHAVVGVVSWGQGCAEPQYPGVYTRVNRYITWIKDNTKDACYC